MEAPKELIDYLRENIDKGIACPCCQQFVKTYRRKITASMAYGLIMLSSRYEGEFHLEKALKEMKILSEVRSDFPKLRFWGLVKQLKGNREDGSSRNGYYKITDAGRLFVHRKIDVQKYIHVYNNKPFKRSGDKINISECLGQKFDYSELMQINNYPLNT